MKKIALSLLLVLSAAGLWANTIDEMNLLRIDDIRCLVDQLANSFYYVDSDGQASFIQMPDAYEFKDVELAADGNDLVYLTNGSVLECQILSQTDESLVVRTKTGNEITLSMSKVEKIVTQVVDGDYNFTITSVYPHIDTPKPTPISVTVTDNNSGMEITKAEEFNLSVFPYLTRVKGKDSPKEAGKPKAQRLDHYVGEGVDFDAVEFSKFLETYCPDAARHYKKMTINVIAASAVSLVFAIGAAINFWGIIDMLVICGVDFFLLGKVLYHMNRPLKVYNNKYANNPVAFDQNANGVLAPPVEQPVYTLVPVTDCK